MAMSPADLARLEQALASAREWFEQLRKDDPADAEGIMRRAGERVPVIRARALAICAELGLAGSNLMIPVWDEIIGWRDPGWVRAHVEDMVQAREPGTDEVSPDET